MSSLLLFRPFRVHVRDEAGAESDQATYSVWALGAGHAACQGRQSFLGLVAENEVAVTVEVTATTSNC